MDVTFRTPEMNLLGYFLRSALRRAVQSLDAQKALAGLDARVLIETGGMQATLVLEHGRVEIARGAVAPLTARISGSLGGLLGTMRTGGFVRAVLLGRVKASGPIGVLLRLRRLFAR